MTMQQPSYDNRLFNLSNITLRANRHCRATSLGLAIEDLDRLFREHNGEARRSMPKSKKEPRDHNTAMVDDVHDTDSIDWHVPGETFHHRRQISSMSLISVDTNGHRRMPSLGKISVGDLDQALKDYHNEDSIKSAAQIFLSTSTTTRMDGARSHTRTKSNGCFIPLGAHSEPENIQFSKVEYEFNSVDKDTSSYSDLRRPSTQIPEEHPICNRTPNKRFELRLWSFAKAMEATDRSRRSIRDLKVQLMQYSHQNQMRFGIPQASSSFADIKTMRRSSSRNREVFKKGKHMDKGLGLSDRSPSLAALTQQS